VRTKKEKKKSGSLERTIAGPRSCEEWKEFSRFLPLCPLPTAKRHCASHFQILSNFQTPCVRGPYALFRSTISTRILSFSLLCRQHSSLPATPSHVKSRPFPLSLPKPTFPLSLSIYRNACVACDLRNGSLPPSPSLSTV